MSLEIGDRVFVIDEDLDGIVQGLSDNNVVLLCDDGFEYEYLVSQLYKLNEDQSIEHAPKVMKIPHEPKTTKQSKTYKKITFEGKKPIFDLHLDELTDSIEFVNDHEKLNFQLSYVREVLFEASKKRIRQLVFVHGIGKGRLREELRKMLKESYPQIEFFDGDYRSFGHGATEIIIRKF